MKTLTNVILILSASAALAADPIGSVVALTGEATGKQPDAEARKLELKSEIYLSDSIDTTKGARLEVMFDDNSVIAVGESSAMTIDQYVYSPLDKLKTSTFTAKYKKGVFRTVSGNIAKINPDRFKVKTRKATIGIRGSDLGTDLRNGEVHFCLQTHNPKGLTITPNSGPGKGQMMMFVQGMQAQVFATGALGKSKAGFFKKLFGGGGPIQLSRIDPRALAAFLRALEKPGQSGGPKIIPPRQANADPGKFRPPVFPAVPLVPVPPEPKEDEPDVPADPVGTLLASGTDWDLLKQGDPVTYYFAGSPMGLAEVTALRAETEKELAGSGSFFATVTHALGNKDLSGGIDFVIYIGGASDVWACDISATSTSGDDFTFVTPFTGNFDAGTGEMVFSGVPTTFSLLVNGQTYAWPAVSSGSLRGDLYGPSGIGPPAPIPTGAGVNLTYTMSDGTAINGAGGANVVEIPPM